MMFNKCVSCVEGVMRRIDPDVAKAAGATWPNDVVEMYVGSSPEALRSWNEHLAAENNRLTAEVENLRSTRATLDRKINLMQRQLEGDPRELATKGDVVAERDRLRLRVSDLETDLAWHKRELARGRKAR